MGEREAYDTGRIDGVRAATQFMKDYVHIPTLEATLDRIEADLTRISRYLALQKPPVHEEPELKPCPFCGLDTAVLIHDAVYPIVKCTTCGARTARYDFEKTARQFWNNRA